MFFIAHYKTAENSPRRFLRTLNESVLTIRIAALVLAYKLYRNPRIPATRHSEAAITFIK